MQVQYQNTPADLATLTRLIPFGQRVLIWMGPFGPLTWSAIPGTLLLIALGDYFALAIGWLLIAILGVYYLVHIRRQIKPPNPKDFLSTTITIVPEEIRSENDRGWARRHWRLVRSIRTTSDFVSLELEQSRFFLIPRRAFGSAGEAERFSARAREFKNQADEPNETSNHTSADGATTVAPVTNDDCMIVQFRLSVEDLAEVTFAGIRPQAQREMMSSKIWFWPMAALVTSSLAVLMRNFQPPIRPLVDLIAFASIAFAMIVLFNETRRYLWKRAFDPRQLARETIVVSRIGIESTSELARTFSSWEAIDAIENDDRFIVIFAGKPQLLHVILKSAFETAEEAQRFVELAERYRQVAHVRQNATPLATDARPLETGNPYQPPRLT